jgi:carboxypeptidase D
MPGRLLSPAVLILLWPALGLCAAPSFVLASDPFAPPGTVLVRVGEPPREAVSELLRLGLEPEEGGRGWLLYRVTPGQHDLIRSLGLSSRIVADYEATEEGRATLWATYAQVAAQLSQIASDHPGLARLTSYGITQQGRALWALKITSDPDAEEAEAEVRIVGAHHGNEKMSTAINMRLANDLTDNYGVDPRVTALVDSREIWIVPIVNPDGYEANSRYNSRGVDLNRNYGYMWTGAILSAFSEAETRAMRDIATDNWFVTSLSFHTSGNIVNSLWNYTPLYCEDDPIVWELTNLYASHNDYWAVRGWYWYETHGDCNDWSYGARGDLDWTIETANSNEAAVWALNRDAILDIIEAAGRGIHGTVTDASSGAPLRARVTVEGNLWPAFTDPVVGDYHKPLTGGTYTVRFSANGHQDLVVPGVVVPPGGGISLDAALAAGGGVHADRVEMADQPDPNNAYGNETLTMSVLGAPDDAGCSLGVGGYVVVDLGPGFEVEDKEGPDLRVYEAAVDAAGEGYSVLVGSAYLGPWTSLGSAVGTAEFDLAGSGVASARYVRLVDDGDGAPDDPLAGMDLDALEVLSSSVSVAEAAALPLSAPRACPNPASAGAGVEFVVDGAAVTGLRLEVFDLAGRRVALLAGGSRAAGLHRFRWSGVAGDGRPVPPGVYFARASSGSAAATAKVVLLR